MTYASRSPSPSMSPSLTALLFCTPQVAIQCEASTAVVVPDFIGTVIGEETHPERRPPFRSASATSIAVRVSQVRGELKKVPAPAIHQHIIGHEAIAISTRVEVGHHHVQITISVYVTESDYP